MKKISTLMAAGMKLIKESHGNVLFRNPRKKPCGCALGAVILGAAPNAKYEDDVPADVLKALNKKYSFTKTEGSTGGTICKENSLGAWISLMFEGRLFSSTGRFSHEPKTIPDMVAELKKHGL